MAGLDAKHGEELHLLTRDLLAAPGVPTVELFGDVQPRWFVGFALVVGVNLRRSVGVSGGRPLRWISYQAKANAYLFGAGAAELLQPRGCKYFVSETF